MLNLTTPAAGDGGYIYIGGESLNEYDPTNPLDGSIIDNADISYMSRIEIQGAAGSSIRSIDTGNAGRADAHQHRLVRYARPAISTRSISSTQSYDVHDRRFEPVLISPTPPCSSIPIRSMLCIETGPASPAPRILRFPTRGGLVGEPVDLYMYNDTISNSGQGVHINSSAGRRYHGRHPVSRRSCSTTRSTTTATPSRRSRRSSTATNGQAVDEHAGDE